jgi:hypothetical protein
MQVCKYTLDFINLVCCCFQITASWALEQGPCGTSFAPPLQTLSTEHLAREPLTIASSAQAVCLTLRISASAACSLVSFLPFLPRVFLCGASAQRLRGHHTTRKITPLLAEALKRLLQLAERGNFSLARLLLGVGDLLGLP